MTQQDCIQYDEKYGLCLTDKPCKHKGSQGFCNRDSDIHEMAEKIREARKRRNHMSKIAVLDIETTGFLGNGGSIVEVGIVELDLSNGEITKVFDKLLKEERFDETHTQPPMGWIFNNSDLTVDDVLNAEPAEDILKEVQEVLNNYPLGCTAFNKKFDFGFLKDRGLTIKELPCPMMLATDVCKLPGRYGKYKWPSVEEAYAHFFPDDEYIEAHRGADDAVHEAKIVHKLYDMGIFRVPVE